MASPLITHLEPETDIDLAKGATKPLMCHEKRNIHGIYLNATVAGGGPATDANWGTDVASITLSIAEKVIIDAMTPAQLLAIYAFHHAKDGALANNGSILLPAVPDHFPYRGSGKAYRWGMLNARGQSAELRLEVTYLSPGALTITRLKPYLIVDEDDPRQMSDHIRWLRTQSAHTATTEQELTTLPLLPNCVGALSYWFDVSVGVISQFSVKRNNATIYDKIPVGVFNREMHRSGMTPQAGWTVLPFHQNLDPSSILPYPGINKLVVFPTWTTAPNNYTIIQQLAMRGLSN